MRSAAMEGFNGERLDDDDNDNKMMTNDNNNDGDNEDDGVGHESS